MKVVLKKTTPNTNQFSKFLSHQYIDRYVGNRKGLNPYVTRVIEKERKSWFAIRNIMYVILLMHLWI